MPRSNISPYSRLVALLLCWILGGLGAHRFYVGKWKSALVMMLVPIVVFVIFIVSILGIGAQGDLSEPFAFASLGGILIPFWLVGVWVFVDLVMILVGAFTDCEGRRVFRWMDAGST
jgi:TM2 domain-containing membrane protein YozV